MNNWLNSVRKNIFPLSIENHDIRKALSEWFYTGDTEDLGEPCKNCELCGHENIRYQFTIKNRITAHELLIGSECITKFQIPALNERGSTLSIEETKKLVSKDRRKMIEVAKVQRMFQTLIELKKKEDDFEAESFITYFKTRGAFTPRQLAKVIWRLNANNVDYYPTDFKLTIKRKREKSQLLELQRFQIANILPCMSASQKEFLDKNSEQN